MSQTCLKFMLLAPALLFVLSTASAAKDSAVAPAGEKSMIDLDTRLEALVHKYYPKAKIKKTATSIHFEYKVKPYDIPQTYTIEPGPEWGGILGDVELKEGHLNEADTVEKKLNQYSYYHVIELQPNSPRSDIHLKTRLAYPFDVQPDFLQDFKSLIRSFDSADKPASTE